MKGWLIPAYPMPTNLTDLTVQRIVVRNGLGMDLADQLINDMKTEVAYLAKIGSATTGKSSQWLPSLISRE